MSFQYHFFTRCPWGDTKSAHARTPPLDGLYIRCVRVFATPCCPSVCTITKGGFRISRTSSLPQNPSTVVGEIFPSPKPVHRGWRRYFLPQNPSTVVGEIFPSPKPVHRGWRRYFLPSNLSTVVGGVFPDNPKSAHCVIEKRRGSPLWLPNHRAVTANCTYPSITHLSDFV